MRDFLKADRTRRGLRLSAREASAFDTSTPALKASETPLGLKGTPKKVVVVGAGVAGLAAAYELTQAGTT
jgi:NADPH-dependent 2,4-dienoyl-CoA reductase/sulfur reductase-like enzyme